MSAVALAGCAVPPAKLTDTGCLWALPIYISDKDVLTDGTAAQILSHDEKWKANCK